MSNRIIVDLQAPSRAFAQAGLPEAWPESKTAEHKTTEPSAPPFALLPLPPSPRPASPPLPIASPPPCAPLQFASELPVAVPSLVAQAPLPTIPEPPAIPDSVRNDVRPEQAIQKELDKEAEYQVWLGQPRPEFLKPGRDAPPPSWAAWALQQAQESAEAIQERLRLRFLGPCDSGPRP